MGGRSAVDRYFRHYKINPEDSILPWDLLDHPLRLRIFCEVANPDRKETVGVEALPTSLSALFGRYLEQVIDRICKLSRLSNRFYDQDVSVALRRLGLALWTTKSRRLDTLGYRKIIKDENRPWDQSLLRALEQDGILIRHASRNGTSQGLTEVAFDALAGHLIAEALISEFGETSTTFKSWIQQSQVTEALHGDYANRHPLATDTLESLVGLIPRKLPNSQLWQFFCGAQQQSALCQTILLEPIYLDDQTVNMLRKLMATSSTVIQRKIFDQLWSTRAAIHHPLDAEFLHSVLLQKSMPDRDLHWSEWLRRDQVGIMDDLIGLGGRWKNIKPGKQKEFLRASWVMWTLTSTVRKLRDLATLALYRYGCSDPKALFDLTLKSLEINDPYVPERMLAACYGVAMSLWADPKGDAVRKLLPEFAHTLVDRMFVPRAPSGTRHVLMRDYGLGVIDLARRIDSSCISGSELQYLEHPFKHLPTPFRDPFTISKEEVAVTRGAIRMDFGNYTLGRLIPDRGNYDYQHPVYKDVRLQIEARIAELGYSISQFEKIDESISQFSHRARIGLSAGADRYGKKYSWIAYFEMYGLRHDLDSLPDWRFSNRTSDADIDPSFPSSPRNWSPKLKRIPPEPTQPIEWLTKGVVPSYDHLLNIDEVDNLQGPWILLEGYIEQHSETDERQVFSFLRSVFVDTQDADKLIAIFGEQDYPGNSAIPEPYEEHYIYAGEIPWSHRYGTITKNSSNIPQPDKREAFEYYENNKWDSMISVEVPVQRFSWESYHSELNQTSGIIVPSPALCHHLKLVNHKSDWSLFDSKGQRASMYCEFKLDQSTYGSSLAYLRNDLLEKYLKDTNQTLIWMIWGERGFGVPTGNTQDGMRSVYSKYQHIHKKLVRWNPSKSNPKNH